MSSKIKDRLHIIYYNEARCISGELNETILQFYPTLEISRIDAWYYTENGRIKYVAAEAASCEHPTIIDFREAEEDEEDLLSIMFRSELRRLEVNSPVMVLTPTEILIKYPKLKPIETIDKDYAKYNFSVATFAFFNRAFNLNCGAKGSYLYLPSTSVSSSFDSAKAIETLKNHEIDIERWNPHGGYKTNIIGIIIVPERTNPGFGYFGVGIETGIKQAMMHGRNVLVMCPNTYAISKPIAMELVPGLATRTSYKRSGMIVWDSLSPGVLLKQFEPSIDTSYIYEEDDQVPVFDSQNYSGTQTQEFAGSLLICASHLGLG